jgi:Fe-S-cluster-containing dehydrogenase component/DMSO reductase anchor subunit
MTTDLPLLRRADLLVLQPAAVPLIPSRKPGPGEQYRFHFDMSRCIGCKCCVVACNEQNGNPAHIQWRRVGEIEGGIYPNAQRWHLSMGCNHCLEPSCLIGCPVDAYTKLNNGVVDHDPDICIGCQYCTWNCSYGVPQYNGERGVVGKCDLCHHRLAADLTPACASACPEQAIRIEIVDIEEWRQDHTSADAPGLPAAADSLSTTRVTMPHVTAEALSRVDLERIRPEEPHWSLTIMLVLTQLSIGVVALLSLLSSFGASAGRVAALAPAIVTAIALAAVTLHLGRPAYAWRALKAWRRSWLSREVAALGLFALVSQAYAASIWYEAGPTALLGVAATIAGITGVICSARIYMVPARPAWNLPHTMIEFSLSCFVLGPRLVLALGAWSGGWLVALAILATVAQLGNQLAKLRLLRASAIHELNASARLFRTHLRKRLAARVTLSALAVAALAISPAAAFCLALAAELLGRHLFFVSVVPKRMAAAYLAQEHAA